MREDEDSHAEPSRGQLHWQCRRGMLELDYVLERYLDECYAAADPAERALFRELLTAQDPELQAWLLNGEPHADPAWQPLIRRIRGI